MDTAGTAPRARAEAFQNHRIADESLGDDELVDIQMVVVLGVGNRTLQVFLTSNALRLRENSRSASAFSTFLPRINCAEDLTSAG